jgi:hypothetical protein
MIAKSSTFLGDQLADLVNHIGNGSLQIFDGFGNLLGLFSLPSPGGIAFGNIVALAGLPGAATALSSSPVNAIPVIATLLSSAGVPLITNIPVLPPQSFIVLASSLSNPGVPIGIIGGEILGSDL